MVDEGRKRRGGMKGRRRGVEVRRMKAGEGFCNTCGDAIAIGKPKSGHDTFRSDGNQHRGNPPTISRFPPKIDTPVKIVGMSLVLCVTHWSRYLLLLSLPNYAE